MSQEGREVAAINGTLADTVSRAIESLNLDHSKSQDIQKALVNLVDIEKVYPQSEEALYGDTLEQLQSVSLFDFELEKIISRLLESYFKQLPLFKESYEIAGLRSKQEKYSRLRSTSQSSGWPSPPPTPSPLSPKPKNSGLLAALPLNNNRASQRPAPDILPNLISTPFFRLCICLLIQLKGEAVSGGLGCLKDFSGQGNAAVNNRVLLECVQLEFTCWRCKSGSSPITTFPPERSSSPSESVVPL